MHVHLVTTVIWGKMRRLLNEISHDDLHDLESNPILLRSTLLSLHPKEFYAFMASVKKKRTFCEKRSKSYRKSFEDVGTTLWSSDVERQKTTDDRKWIDVCDNVYDNPRFWYELWKRKETTWYDAARSKPRYKDIVAIEYEDDDELDVQGIAMEEYFFRCVELVFLTRSMIKLVKRVGKLLLNDERVLYQLKSRENIDRYATYVKCGLLHDFGPELSEENGTARANKDAMVGLSVSHMQNVVYVLERMQKKEGSFKFEPLTDLKRVVMAVIPTTFPFNARLYASAFVRSVTSYCAYRCNVKRDLVFLPKPSSTLLTMTAHGNVDKRFVTYDLKHNVAFDTVALFFKYNVYTFNQRKDDPTFETLCLYDVETEIINSCVEFGFENIMEFDVLEQLVCTGLEAFCKRDQRECVLEEEIKRDVEWQRWRRLFKSTNNELRSISVLPCVMSSDRDLLHGDDVRLTELRLILESRLLGESRFPKVLTYLLHVSVVRLQGECVSNYDFTSPDALRYFFVKKRFVSLLYERLKNKDLTVHNEISSIEKLERFLVDKAPFIVYTTVEIDTERLPEYLRFIDDVDGVDGRYYCENVLEDDENESNDDDNDEEEKRRRLSKKIRSGDLLMPRNDASRNDADDDGRRKRRTKSLYVDIEDENEGYDDASTDHGRSDDASRSANDNGEDTNATSNTTESSTLKRKRTSKIVITNVHKDCFLFTNSFYSYNICR